MRFIIKRRTVVTEVATIDLPSHPSDTLDTKAKPIDPEALATKLDWKSAEETDDWDGLDDGVSYVVRVDDYATAVSLFDQMAVEFRPGCWRIPTREGHGAVVLAHGGRWLAGTQDDGDGNSQVHQHEFFNDIDDAKSWAIDLFFQHTQPLP